MGRQRPDRSPADRAESDAGSAAEKTCASCGRRIEWRAAWARDWDDIRYCSDACRRRRVTEVDRRIEDALHTRLRRERVFPSGELDASLSAIEPRADRETVRRAARRLVAAGAAEIVQGGRVVDPSTARGPFELRRR